MFEGIEGLYEEVPDDQRCWDLGERVGRCDVAEDIVEQKKGKRDWGRAKRNLCFCISEKRIYIGYVSSSNSESKRQDLTLRNCVHLFPMWESG